jgi:adenylate cyclase
MEHAQAIVIILLVVIGVGATLALLWVNNRTLEDRVKAQGADIERLELLKRFFPAGVVEMILDKKGFDPLKVHRNELTAICVDIRGFTAFAENAEPEEVMAILRRYHRELGNVVTRHGATLETFAGDGAMIFINDPVPHPHHALVALQLAAELQLAMRPLFEEWRRQEFDLGLGAGVATGFATVGVIGYEGRWEYAAIGSVCNLSARLCAESRAGDVLLDTRAMLQAGDAVKTEPAGEMNLKGFAKPVPVFKLLWGD